MLCDIKFENYLPAQLPVKQARCCFRRNQREYSMIFFINLIIIYILLAAVALIFSAAYAFSKENTWLTRTFALLCSYLTIYLIAQLLAFNSGYLEQLLFWQQIQYFILPLFPGIWLLISGLNRKNRFLTKTLIVLGGLLLPLLIALYYFGLRLQSVSFPQTVFRIRELFPLPLPITWSWPAGQLLFLFFCLCLAFYLFGLSLYTAGKKTRFSVVLMILASLLPWGGLFLDPLVQQYWGVDYTAIVYPLACFLWLVAMLNFRHGQMPALAQEALFLDAPEGIIVLRPDKQIVDFNPAAAVQFPALQSDATGRDLLAILGWDDLLLQKLFDEKSCRFSQIIGGETLTFLALLTSLEAGRDQENGFVLTLRDVSKTVQAEEVLATSELLENQRQLREMTRFQTAFITVQDGIIVLDKNYRITLLNQAAEKLTGWIQAEAQGKQLEEVFPLLDELTGDSWGRPLAKKTFHALLVTKDGSEIPVESSAKPLTDEDDQIVSQVIVFRDSRAYSEKDARIAYLSDHDPLTDLYNRHYLDQEMHHLDRLPNLPITLAIIDINGLKLVNDALGHQAGDDLLIRAAAVIRNECRGNDISARVGGDEFVLLLPKTGGALAEKIVQRISEALTGENIMGLPLSVSFGWATKSTDQEDLQKIYRQAEDQMYRTKLAQRTTVRKQIIQTMIQTLYEKSNFEQEHSEKVSQISLALAIALNLEETELSELSRLGLIHDIGKIRIDAQILKSTEPLTPEQWREIQWHAESGYRILSSVNEFSPLADLVLAHHEHWDGSGYPAGLQDEKIPFQSRIIAVADAYAAMTSDRPYRPAMSHEQAVAELKKGAGSQFDPELVAAFMTIPSPSDKNSSLPPLSE